MTDEQKTIKILDAKITEIIKQNNLLIQLVAKTQLRREKADKVLAGENKSIEDLEREIKEILEA